MTLKNNWAAIPKKLIMGLKNNWSTEKREKKHTFIYSSWTSWKKLFIPSSFRESWSSISRVCMIGLVKENKGMKPEYKSNLKSKIANRLDLWAVHRKDGKRDKRKKHGNERKGKGKKRSIDLNKFFGSLCISSPF